MQGVVAVAQQDQQQKRDSMIALLPSAKEDSAKVILLNRIGDEFAYSDFKTATAYYEQAFTLSKKLDFTRGIIRYYSSQGEILNMDGKYAACLALLQKGLVLSIEKKDKMRQGIMNENIGNTFALMQKLDSAVHYYFQSLVIFEAFKDTIKIANVYADLSSVYTQTDMQEKALLYADKALAVSQNKKDGFYLAGLINKEAILWKLKYYDEADTINEEIITLAKEQQDDLALAGALQNYCNHNEEKQNFSLLYDYARQLLAVAQRLQSNEQRMIAYYWMATAHYYKKDFSAAQTFILDAIGKAEADSNSLRMKESYLLYSKILLVKNGDLSLSHQYAAKADSLEQQILNENILKATHNAEEQYESVKKENQIQLQATELKEKKKTNIVLAASLLLVVAALILLGLWMRNRQRLLEKEKELQAQKIIQLENEKQLMATQAVLKGQEEERSRLAKDLHDGLGGILSSAKYSFNNMKQQFILSEENAKAFERSMSMLDESIAELRRVAHNMMPETLMKLTLNEALQDYCQQLTDTGVLPVTYQSFGMDDLPVDNTVKTTVYRVVQELTNNIIKHAEASKALVQLIAKDSALHITVEDDGKGFDPVSLTRVSGIGYKNTKSRIDFLKGKLDIQSKKSEGTSVYIEIPL